MRRMIALALMLIPSSLLGQRSALREVRDRGAFGINVAVAQAFGAFRRNGDGAVGITAFGVTGGKTLGLRIDGGWMVYDYDYQGYGLTTTSQIGTLAVGPQITIGRGPVRLVGFATAGGSLFWTSASDRYACGCYGSDDFIVDGDFTTTMSAGVGLLVTVHRGTTPVSFDLGVRGVRHDLVKYVPANGISANPDGSLTVNRVESAVEMRVFHFGVSIGIR